MNVAHCIHGLDLGGAQQVIKHLVRRSDRDAFTHFVYSPSGGIAHEEIEKAGGHVRIVERRLPKLDPLWVGRLVQAMRRDAIDVVHGHLFGDSLHGYLAAQLAGALPVVLTLHIGPEGQTRLQGMGYRWLLSRSARSIACTESVARSWGADCGVAMDVIANGIEPPTRTSPGGTGCADAKGVLGIAAGTQVVGAIGRLVEQKRFHDLISAFAHLCRSSDRDLRLVLVGDGPLRSQLRRQAEHERVGHLVVFTGARNDVPELLRAFEVLAFASGYEGLPMALLEGMAAARAIVGTTAPGILDAVEDRREALVVPVGDPGRLSAALAELLGDPGLRQQLAGAARERFLGDFTAAHMVARYEEVYREVCPVRSQPAALRPRAVCDMEEGRDQSRLDRADPHKGDLRL